MKSFNINQILFSLATAGFVSAQSFCSSAKHSGQSVTNYSNTVSTIGDVGYELWADSGSNSATFYSDGSFSCSFQNAGDYLCRAGLSFDSTQSHQQIGHMYADFKLVKQNIANVDYSFVGVYGWTRQPLVEYYIVDNWLSQYRPADWVGDTKFGDFVIDGAEYTVYKNTRTGPSIDGDTTFTQYFSIRKEARDCGTIDISAHFAQWEKLGMKLGVMHEAKVLGEAGSNNGGTSGTADFPYAKVYINNNGGNAAAAPAPAPAPQAQAPVAQAQAPVAQAPVQAAPAPAASGSNFCSSAKHSGQSVTNYSNTVSTIGDVGYELWADSGSNSATFYSDGSFSCSFQNAGDYLCRAGLSFDSTQSHQQIGHMYADFKLVKQNIANVDYSFVGVYGWTRQPLVEYYIVDNWLSQYRPADWVGDTKFGDFVIDGAEYTVYKNTRTGPSIDGDTTFTQYFSIRKEARDCGTIDISAHFAQWEKLGMKLGVMHEAKVLGEAGSNNGGTSGTADFPYAKVYINNNGGNAAAPVAAAAPAPVAQAQVKAVVDAPVAQAAPAPAPVQAAAASDFCSSAKHSGQSVTNYSNTVSTIGDVGYELWADSGSNSATFYSDGSFSCSFQNAGDYLCRAGLSFDSTQSHQQIGHMYADFKLVKQNIANVDYSFVGVYGWTRQPLVEYYIVDNWLSQYRPADWVGDTKFGDFVIDGAEYTVYKNTRTGPSIDGDTTFTQYFSIRKEARDCGTIDISAHFAQWEKLGMKLGVMHEAKVLGEAGSNNGGTSGTADFPYAKVYINNNGGNAAAPVAAAAPAPVAQAQVKAVVDAPVAQAAPAPAPVQAAAASDFCSSAKHSGQSVTNYSNTVSTIGDVGYELWADSGSNSATFYSDGSFSCSFQNAGDYLCRAGLSFDSTQSHQQIGHMYADFKLVKQNIANVDYSFVGVYGWTRQPLVEYYIVDNWLSQYRPADWVGDTKFGDFVIDGAEYTVYKNTRTGPSIDGDTTFTQYFSIRKEARDCGTIDISAHFAQWEKLGMKLGVMHEAKVLGEAGSNNGGTSGTADFPYAKVYINNNGGNAAAAPAPAPAAQAQAPVAQAPVAQAPVQAAPAPAAASNFCSSAKHSGQSVTNYSNTVSTIGDVGYELWADSGSNSATFYSDGSFSCSFQNAGDYLCRAGLSFDSTQSHQQIGHMYADFKLVKQNIANVDYSFVGVYGWTRQPLVEYYIVDNWLSQYRPADWVGDTKFGDFVIDGAEYTVYKNTRTGPSIDGDTTFTQYFSIRKEARDCGTIDISAHFAQWEKLGMKLGVMHEAKVLGEAGSNNGGTSGTADFPYAKVYINNNGGNAAAAPAQAPAAQAQAPAAQAQAPAAQAPVQAAPAPAAASNFCSSAKHSGQSVTNYSNTVSTIGDVGYELWADSGSNSATFYSDGSFSCSFQNAGDYLCRAGLSFDSTQSHQQIGHMYADFKLVKQNIANVDYSFVGVYGWTRQPLVEYYIVDNWLSQYRPADWVGDTKFGDFVIDGAEYTVYKNTRTGPSIDGDTTFTQYFSIRKEARDCGTIDISAHFAQWEKLGMKLGVMHEAKVLGEAGSNNGGTSGTADFPYAKVYINNNSGNAAAPAPAQAPAPVPAAPKYPKGNGFQFYTQCVNPKDWAMTYDDGPTEYADAILDLLKEKGVKATFFVLGKFYMDSSNPEWARIIKRMDSEGHIIGTHTFSHQDLTQLSYDQILDEMNKITDAVYKVIGKKPVFMRPPYGSGRGNQTVMGALQGLGYNAAVTWNVDPMDYSNGGDINYAVSAIKQTIGQPIITLNHLKYEGDSLNGILALAKAEIDTLLGAGYRSVTMEECLGMSAYE